jgi:hypothetical protein
MAHHLLVVEGAHDAAVFGHLLAQRGFRQLRLRREFPEFWHPLIPERYPTDANGRLDRVIRVPDFFLRGSGSDSCAVITAGGNIERLVKAFRTVVERLDLSSFAAIGLTLDADWEASPSDRFRNIRRKLDQLNTDAANDLLPGFPFAFPDQPGLVVAGQPRFGIFVFPDNERQGTLESTLLGCARQSFPVIEWHADSFIESVLNAYRGKVDDIPELRKRSGQDKARAGAIATVLQPGASLAVSLIRTSWLGGSASQNPDLSRLSIFLDELLLIAS